MTATHRNRAVRLAVLDESRDSTSLHDVGPESTQSEPLHHIFLLVRYSDVVQCFDLPANSDRVVTIGSSDEVDLRLCKPGVARLQCFFERIHDDVWLVPAYSATALRVNAARVNFPQKLGSRAVIEFGPCMVTAELEFTPPSNVVCALGSGIVQDAVETIGSMSRLPEREPSTWLPWQPSDGAPLSSNLSQTITVQPNHSNPQAIEAARQKSHNSPLNRTLPGLAPSDSTPPSTGGRQCEPHAEGPVLQRQSTPELVANSKARGRTNDLRAPSDWLYLLGRRAKYHPAHTSVMAILLALLAAVLVVCGTQALLERLGN